MEVPLKEKYRVGGKSRYKSSTSTSGVRKVTAVTKRRGAHQVSEPVQMVMIVGPTGKTRMQRAG